MTPSARRWLIHGLKLSIGAVVVWVVFQQIVWEDVVQLRDGTERRGRVASTTFAVAVGGPSDTPTPVVLGVDAELQERGGIWRVLEEGAVTQQGEVLTQSGHVVIRESGVDVPIPFDAVRLGSDRNDDGWVERRPDVREGFRTLIGRISWDRYALAMGCIFSMYLCGIRRWQILLRAQGIDVSFAEAFRLTFIGFFFNNVVPGMTGGDVVKAVLVARAHPGRGPDAVSTVIVDRVLGLLVLAALAGLVVPFALDRYGTIALWIYGMLGGAAVFTGLFLSRRVRRLLRIDRLLSRLPAADILRRLDRAFLLYRDRKLAMARCLGLSAVSHVFNVLAVYLLGLDLGVDPAHGLSEPAMLTYFVVVPIIMIVAAVPLLPGGWGVGEAAFGYFFRTVGIHNPTLSIGLSVLHRVSMLLWSLLGGVFLILARRSGEPVPSALTSDG